MVTLISRKRTFSREKMLEFIGGLTAAPSDNAQTLYLPTQLSPKDLEDSINRLGESPELIAKLSEDCCPLQDRDGYLLEYPEEATGNTSISCFRKAYCGLNCLKAPA